MSGRGIEWPLNSKYLYPECGVSPMLPSRLNITRADWLVERGESKRIDTGNFLRLFSQK